MTALIDAARAADAPHDSRAVSRGDRADPQRWRLFVAADVPGRVRQAVDAAAAPLRQDWPALRWTEAEAWHLTAVFLGPVPVTAVPPLADGLAAACAAADPVTVVLRSTAGRTRSGVLWVELEDAPGLTTLAAALRQAGAAAGVDVEDRPLRGHLTLARARERHVPRGLVEAYAGPAASWTVDRLVLYRSHLGRAGARYEALRALPLGQSQ